jgi:propane monooxygenase small subunit
VSAKPPLEGHRSFTWIKPQKQRPTEYEAFTVGQQSNPERWLHVDWPVVFEDGRPPFTEKSTALRCGHWEDYRDPQQVWQRPYVARLNREEQSLETFSREVLQQGLAQGMNPVWRSQVLGKYYAAWPFVDYGQCIALCYCVREALADTITFMLAFQAADKLRHSQDIVHQLFDVREAFADFCDDAARPAWMEDEALIPLREHVERICSCRDWAEIFVAATLVLEPLAGALFKDEFLARNASLNGDPVTPMVLAGLRRDCRRHVEAAKAFVRLVSGDQEHGEANRKVLGAWLDHWLPGSERAALALRPVFALAVHVAQPFETCLERVRAEQRSILRELGLAAGESE